MLKYIKKKFMKNSCYLDYLWRKKKEIYLKYIKDDNIVFYIKYFNVLYINNIYEEELFDLILLFLIILIYNWNFNILFKV